MTGILPSPGALGDFQTPVELAEQVWSAVDMRGIDVIVEPTVGLGAFLKAAPPSSCRLPWLAFDLNPAYIVAARSVASSRKLVSRLEVADAFDLGAHRIADATHGRVVLAIGNPPWVTSAAQGGLAHANLPAKSNRFGLRGLDAITGKANFDIAESILLAVLGALDEAVEIRLAFLIKRSVAIKMARDLFGLPGLSDVSFASIDARKWFGASVEAGLFQLVLRPTKTTTVRCMSLADSLDADATVVVAGEVDGRFVQDVEAYSASCTVEATEGTNVVWRQGIKHDVARLLEFTRGSDGELTNGFGEAIELETDVLSPLFKSSDVAADRAAGRLFPLYQHDLSGPLPDLASRWPLLATYLASHVERFRTRGSSIYRGKPDFMLFGVGQYTLAPYKVAVSGFYKVPHFSVLEMGDLGGPPLVDDTCYLLPFDCVDAARAVATYLNSARVSGFLLSVADVAAKRPFTKEVLGRVRIPDELACLIGVGPPSEAIGRGTGQMALNL